LVDPPAGGLLSKRSKVNNDVLKGHRKVKSRKRSVVGNNLVFF